MTCVENRCMLFPDEVIVSTQSELAFVLIKGETRRGKGLIHVIRGEGLRGQGTHPAEISAIASEGVASRLVIIRHDRFPMKPVAC